MSRTRRFPWLSLASLGVGSLLFAQDGTELLRTPAREMNPKGGWIQTEKPLTTSGLKGKVVLVRFWTDGCHWCFSTAPALKEFHETYAAKGLAVIGMYTPKPPRDATPDEVRGFAKRFGFAFPVGLDNDHGVLNSWWLAPHGRRLDRKFTSVSFLLDRKGIVRKIHFGPEFFASDDPEHAQANRDYLDMKKTVEALLAEPVDVGASEGGSTPLTTSRSVGASTTAEGAEPAAAEKAQTAGPK